MMSGFFLRSVRPAGLVCAMLCAVACSSGGGGDLDSVVPRPKPVAQTGTPIAKANDPLAPLVKYCGTKCPTGAVCQKECPTLNARGVVVVAVDEYDERGDGSGAGNIYVQDALQDGPRGTPWSGLTLFRVTRVPSTLSLIPGMGVDVAGIYQPFPGPTNDFPSGIVLPEVISGAISQSYEAAPPAPIPIAMADLSSQVSGMQFVGRLVRMENVTISSTFDLKYHEAAIDGTGSTRGSIVNIAGQLFNLEDPKGLAAAKGKTYKSVTGVLNYFYNFKLCPRTLEDIEQ
jgi:hypothetical protein